MIGTVVGLPVAALCGGASPAHEIEQIYYLGVFDPHEQLPPSVYRLTVRGQSSLISRMSFGSGWVPAAVVDSLSTNISAMGTDGRVNIQRGDEKDLAQLKTGRRLMMFGPEGFREAPKDHRLVIVMGASPDEFFKAVDEVLGEVSTAQESLRHSGLKTELLKVLLRLRGQSSRLGDLKEDVRMDLGDK